MNFKFRPMLNELETRETPSDVTGSGVPTDPTAPTQPVQSQPVDPTSQPVPPGGTH